tara:strand:- start:29674 stop:30204 length:531 start_codon:yes stop_codon:yes gene_type:complete
MSDKKPVNPNAVYIDARAATYDGEAVRILAVTLADTGKILVSKTAEWRDQPVAKGDTIVVTDTPNVFNHWSLSFNEKEQMQAVMAAYKASLAAGLLVIDSSVQRYDPKQVIQTRKVDERGKALDFDSMGINNGHIAVLLAVWAARSAHGGYVITRQPDPEQKEDEADEFDMMPFSI